MELKKKKEEKKDIYCSRFRWNGSTQRVPTQISTTTRRVREFYRPQERRKLANTSPGMNLTGGVTLWPLRSQPTRQRIYFFFPLLLLLKQGGWDWKMATLFEKLEYRGFSLADVSSRIVPDTGEMLRTLRNKGDGQVSGKFNLFHKLASRGSLRLNPEKLYRSTVYESFHPTSAPSFPSDYRSVIVARLLGTENFETTPTAQGVKRKRWYRNEKKEKRESISRLVARFVKERK